MLTSRMGIDLTTQNVFRALSSFHASVSSSVCLGGALKVSPRRAVEKLRWGIHVLQLDFVREPSGEHLGVVQNYTFGWQMSCQNAIIWVWFEWNDWGKPQDVVFGSICGAILVHFDLEPFWKVLLFGMGLS